MVAYREGNNEVFARELEADLHYDIMLERIHENPHDEEAIPLLRRKVDELAQR